MSEYGALFGHDSPEPVAPPVLPVSDSLVARLREKLDATGLTSMEDRRGFIEELAGRSVASLRDLTYAEARDLLASMPIRESSRKPQEGSAWDQREGDTWIDRL